MWARWCIGLLQRIAADGPASWDEARVRKLRPLVMHWLRELGVAEAELDAVADDVSQAVDSDSCGCTWSLATGQAAYAEHTPSMH